MMVSKVFPVLSRFEKEKQKFDKNVGRKSLSYVVAKFRAKKNLKQNLYHFNYSVKNEIFQRHNKVIIFPSPKRKEANFPAWFGKKTVLTMTFSPNIFQS